MTMFCPHCGHRILERKAGEPRFGMTPKEKTVLEFLISFNAKQGYFPTYNEMISSMNFKSKASIHRLIKGLVDKQYIDRMPSRSRAIAVVPQ